MKKIFLIIYLAAFALLANDTYGIRFEGLTQISNEIALEIINGDKNIITYFENKNKNIAMEDSVQIEDSVDVEESSTTQSANTGSSELLYEGDEEADEGCGFATLTKLESNCSKE